MTEHELQAACIEWLELHGWRVLRLNSGKAFVNGRAITLCPEGTPDTLALRPTPYGPGIVQATFFEIKQPGKSPTLMQQLRMKEWELYGARCLVVHSLDELEQSLVL